MSFSSKQYPYSVRFRRMAVPRLDGDGDPIVNKKGETVMEPGKFTFKRAVPVGKRADFEAHWKKEGLNPTTVLDGLLNQMEKQSKEGFKAEVRSSVLLVEKEIYTPTLTLKQLQDACRKDPRVVKALEDMQANVTANHIGQPRNRDVTKTAASKVGQALLNADPDRLKALAEELGVDIS